MQFTQLRHVEVTNARTAATAADILSCLLANEDHGEDARWDSACARLVRHPMVVGACVIGGDGQPAAASWRFSEAEGPVATAVTNADGSTTVQLPAAMGRPRCTAYVVDSPLPVAKTGATDLPAQNVAAGTSSAPGTHGGPRLRLALILPETTIAWHLRVWLWSIPLLIIGAVSSALAVRKLRSQFQCTLSKLEAIIRAEGSEGALAQLSKDDELAELASALIALQRERNEWRARAEQAARTVDAHVAQRTQAIHRELKKAQRDVWTDPLTGLNNRRVLQDQFAAIHEAQCEAKQDLSVVMLDIDHFKQLNDTLGHVCGDQLLKFAADLLRGALRSNDLAVRYGGDEFTLVLPSVSAKDAAAIARRIITLFAQRTKLLPQLESRPSLSAGVASLWEHPQASPAALLELADQALYDAKRQGKNDVCVCSAAGVNTPAIPTPH